MHRSLPASSLTFLAPPPALPPAARRFLTLAVVAVHVALAAWLAQAAGPQLPRAAEPVLAVELVAPPAPNRPAPAAARPDRSPDVPLPRPPQAPPVPLPPQAAPASRPVLASPSATAEVAVAEAQPAAPAAPAASAPAAPPPAADGPAVAVVLADTPAPTAASAPARELPPSSVAYRDPPAPVYPRASRRAGEAGLVVVRVFVDEAGRPRAVQLARSSGHARLDAAATDAVLQARFHPPTDQGRPTAGWARIPIPFELETLP